MVCGTGQKLSHFSVRSTHTKCIGSLHAVEISKDFYPSPSDLSHHKSLQFIPLSLMTFLSY
jgi:hypothetical protein